MDSASAARAQAKAASRQVAISLGAEAVAEESLRISETPELSLDGVTCSTQAISPLGLNTEVHLKFNNTGRGTAIDITSHFNISLIGNRTHQRITSPAQQTASITMLGSGSPLETTPTKIGDNMGGDQLSMVNAKKLDMHVWGWLSYKDRFHRSHLLVYDLIYEPNTACGFMTMSVVPYP